MYEDGTVDKIAQKYDKYGIPDGIIYPEQKSIQIKKVIPNRKVFKITTFNKNRKK